MKIISRVILEEFVIVTINKYILLESRRKHD